MHNEMPLSRAREILGLSSASTDDDLERAYRLASKKWHPDVNKSAEAIEMMQQINVAVEVLREKGCQASDSATTPIDEDPFESAKESDPNLGVKERPFLTQRGADCFAEVTISHAQGLNGTIVTVAYQKGKKAHEIRVRVPSGTISSRRLRIQGEGLKGKNGGDSGDLYVQVTVLPPKAGKKIRQEIAVTFSEARMGTTLEVPVFVDNHWVNITVSISSQTKNGQVLRLVGQGNLGATNSSPRGDIEFIVRVAEPVRGTDIIGGALVDYQVIKQMIRTGIALCPVFDSQTHKYIGDFDLTQYLWRESVEYAKPFVVPGRGTSGEMGLNPGDLVIAVSWTSPAFIRRFVRFHKEGLEWMSIAVGSTILWGRNFWVWLIIIGLVLVLSTD